MRIRTSSCRARDVGAQRPGGSGSGNSGIDRHGRQRATRQLHPEHLGQLETRFNTALPEKGASLTSPVTGTIVRWRIQGAEGGPYYLRVLTPNSKGAYEASGTSGPATPSGTGLQTFTAHIPIKAGDLIGIDPTHTTDGDRGRGRSRGKLCLHLSATLRRRDGRSQRDRFRRRAGAERRSPAGALEYRSAPPRARSPAERR